MTNNHRAGCNGNLGFCLGLPRPSFRAATSRKARKVEEGLLL
jgi:hypothetical protein